MWYSTECSEDAPFITPADVDTAEQALTPPLRTADIFNMQGRLSICQFWKVSPLAPIHKQAVTSGTPTFIMEGEYDPVTPPANGQLTVSTLANGTLLVFPGVGHGVMYTGPCPLQIALGFFASGDKPPALDCYAQMGEPSFI
jgi:pimeloyl-ACP methyl ester carboxylesterase